MRQGQAQRFVTFSTFVANLITMWRPLLVVCLLACSTSKAQVTFLKTFDAGNYDYIEKVVPTEDGGYVMVGNTLNTSWDFDTPADVWVIRTDAYGDTLWTRAFGVANRLDVGFDITQTSDGGFAIAGMTIGENFWEDGMIMKIDGSGTWQWTHIYRGDYFAEDQLRRIRELANGDLVAAGYVRRPNSNVAGYVVRTNSEGEKIWSKTYGGAQSGDVINDIWPTSDGGLALCGSTNSYDVGQSDMWLIKTNGSGEVEWSKTVGGESAEGGASVVGTDDGGYMWYGPTAFSLLAVRTNSTGDTLWTRTYYVTGQPSYSGIRTQMDKVSIGGYIITYKSAQDAPDALLIRVDDMGDVTWARTTPLAFPQTGFGVRSTPDGGFVLCGVGTDQTQNVPFLLKADSAGQTSCGSADVGVTSTLVPIELEVHAVTPLVTTPDQEGEPVFTTHGGATIGTVCFSVGVSEPRETVALGIYPNPASEQVQITLSAGSGSAMVSVVDAMGRCVLMERTPNATTTTLDLTGQPTGVYTVVVERGDVRTTGRLVIGAN